MVFIGIYFMAYNLNYGYPYFSYVLNSVAFILLIAIPVLTMRSFAEERKNRTDQLLFTSPVNLFGVVMGKYLAMVTIFAIPCALWPDFSVDYQGPGERVFKGGLSYHSAVLPAGVCLHCDWNVHIFSDRECDSCSNRKLWCSAYPVSVERSDEFPPKFGRCECGGASVYCYASYMAGMAYDEELAACRMS